MVCLFYQPDLAFECSFMYDAGFTDRHESHRSIMALNVHFFGDRLLSTRNFQPHFCFIASCFSFQTSLNFKGRLYTAAFIRPSCFTMAAMLRDSVRTPYVRARDHAAIHVDHENSFR